MPDWLVKKVSASSATRLRSSLWEELEHWNQFTNLSVDTLADTDRIVKQWDEGGHSSNAKVAAALLHHGLRDKFPSESKVRNAVLRGEAIPVVTTTVPEAKFACSQCGARCYTHKEARYHCTLLARGSVKRGR